MVGDPGKAVSAPMGLGFYKMSGSGNDFVVFDGRQEGTAAAVEPLAVRALCDRRTGVGADGVVLLAPEPEVAFRMIYINADGSRAGMCGNAALCSTRLAVELGLAPGEGMEFETDSGRVRARLVDGQPEIDLAPIREVDSGLDLPREPGERRMGFVEAGVPHLVIEVDAVDGVDVQRRGRMLRHDKGFAAGANVDFVARDPGGSAWSMRTYERGVEDETLACGTGAVSCALMLRLWGLSGDETRIRTRSSRIMRVRLRREGVSWLPALAGEGRVVYEGRLRDVDHATFVTRGGH